MNELAPGNALEVEIQQTLAESTRASEAVQRLLRKYEILDLSIEDFRALAQFLLRGQFFGELCDLCIKKLDGGSVLPWAQFAQALSQLSPNLPRELRSAIVAGAGNQKQSHELARTHCLDSTHPELANLRAARKHEQQTKYRSQKQELLGQLEMFRSQELETEEEKVLEHLLHLFPLDRDLADFKAQLHERKAVRILEQKLQDKTALWDRTEIRDADEISLLQQVEASMRRTWEQYHRDEELGRDFAIAFMMWDYPDAAVDFLSIRSNSNAIAWLRMEALYLARQYVTLLDQVETISIKRANDPDTTFAVSYIRAMALWGLGHRIAAIEIMENIVSLRPSYRSASGLLRLWKGED